MNGLAPDHLETGLVVVGAGPGGYAAAFRAADLGMRVTLVDPEPNPGGVCLYRGCIPSKAYLHMAALIEEASAAGEHGVSFGEPQIDAAKMLAWKDSVVETLTGGLGTLCKSRGIEFVRGRGVFYDAHTLELHSHDADWKRVFFDKCIIATGSRPVVPPSLAADSPRIMNSTGALALGEVPKTMLVVGGGYIGLELATVYATLGSEVSVVEMTPTLLPGADRDLVRVLAKRLEPRMHEILLETKVASLKAAKDHVLVTLEGAAARPPERRFEYVLVAAGRRPNSSGLGLASTAVQIDQQGFIEVDEHRRTAEHHIYAIGDVAGEPMLAHKATHEGITAAECAAGRTRAFAPQAIPTVVFTDPEIAWCGLTEEQAKKEGIEIEVGRFPWAASGRALTLARPDGMTKLLVEPGSRRILGAGIVGAGAGNLIAEAVLAIEMGATAEDLALSVHPHPTLSETLMEAADAIYGLSVHVHKRRKK